MNARDETVTLGQVSGLHGVNGWVRVFSHTDPPNGILQYESWMLERDSDKRVFRVITGREQGRRLFAKLEGLDDRDAAAAWVGAKVTIERRELPPTGDSEYYWADLIGLEVRTVDDQVLGTVRRLMETGANDVLVVVGDRERLIPWLPGRVITDVDLDSGEIRVDWDPEF